VEENSGPVAAINPSDINALAHILSFYERWIVNTLAPSSTRNKQVSQIQFLLVKVSLLGSSKVAVLTYDEVACIDDALSVFTQQVREKIPQSKSREGVLESCEELREYLVKSLTSLDQNHCT
jgi:hypothetical protein